ncbi:MAG: cyclic-di-AMP receptor [Chloroflexi bacterium]|nr:cyclic-di-AMP receptor [Chloroflexota bacterium]MBU1662686.1 cyclic-di-AMP receptor [Chloroflexota bacterium]
MKMIFAIVDDTKSAVISQALLTANFRVTQLASTGGFLRGGATTLMVGVDDDKVEPALQVIRELIPPLSDPDEKQATLYVLNVKSFDRV